MAVRIDQVLEYLDHHPVCYYADDVESLLGMLYDVYAKHNTISSFELDSLRQKLDVLLETVSAGKRMRCSDLVDGILKEHGQQAFVHGVIVGLFFVGRDQNRDYRKQCIKPRRFSRDYKYKNPPPLSRGR